MFNLIETYLVKWIKDYVKKAKLRSLVVGVSGGVDSAVVSALCARTNLPVHCLIMPIEQDPTQTKRGRDHVYALAEKYPNVVLHEVDLTEQYLSLKNKFADICTRLSLANTKSRLRMVTLYNFATVFEGIVVGTGNKVEDYGIGFFTKYGDGGVDISPLGNFLKTEVRLLATHLGVNPEIVNAAPTDGLWEGSPTDEQQIGATYEELEWAMAHYEDPNPPAEPLSERQKEVLEIYRTFNEKNQHKMVPIPVFPN